MSLPRTSQPIGSPLSEDAGDVDKVLEKIRLLIELSDDDIARARSEMKRSAPFLPVTLRDRVTRQKLNVLLKMRQVS